MILILDLLLVFQLEIDGDFLYFLADAAVTAVIDMNHTFSLLIYSCNILYSKFTASFFFLWFSVHVSVSVWKSGYIMQAYC
jgi:hypothetical protein